MHSFIFSLYKCLAIGLTQSRGPHPVRDGLRAPSHRTLCLNQQVPLSRLQVILILVLPQKMELRDLKGDCRNCVCSALNPPSFPITVTDHSANGRVIMSVICQFTRKLISFAVVHRWWKMMQSKSAAVAGLHKRLATQLDYCDPLRVSLCIWQD